MHKILPCLGLLIIMSKPPAIRALPYMLISFRPHNGKQCIAISRSTREWRSSLRRRSRAISSLASLREVLFVCPTVRIVTFCRNRGKTWAIGCVVWNGIVSVLLILIVVRSSIRIGRILFLKCYGVIFRNRSVASFKVRVWILVCFISDLCDDYFDERASWKETSLKRTKKPTSESIIKNQSDHSTVNIQEFVITSTFFQLCVI